ncbi:hypothetical protein [Oxynema aestuarii]|uniref:Uncharacterized protein n=1 Tax=Oxynema aestuarii AP17 TaxID=2064643 RepID=A0A6H1U4Y2_9CYAN|nr:hypothetical protein [Oxynema aestuarii]QIZ73210.1 hypothetical protein HCG48_23575 [Oxynema aestuarii AP17]RMH77544.1 MAG: hypothetical protein D6680_04865 [Cyanobacteria bacterium J007]
MSWSNLYQATLCTSAIVLATLFLPALSRHSLQIRIEIRPIATTEQRLSPRITFAPAGQCEIDRSPFPTSRSVTLPDRRDRLSFVEQTTISESLTPAVADRLSVADPARAIAGPGFDPLRVQARGGDRADLLPSR